MAILTVGSGEQYATLAAAVAASHDGDTVYVQAGTYVNDFATIRTKINIVGVGGLAHFVATQSPSNGKAILVTKTDVSIDHLEFSGAKVSAGNGGGIRYEGGKLTVTNSYFHDNQDGILAAGFVGGVINIDHTEFAHNGAGDGQSHNIYVGPIDTFTMTNSYSHDAVVGHEVKSRAHQTTLSNNRIFDNNGSASYSIDLPNGGDAAIKNNIIQQGPFSQNPAIIAYSMENPPYAGSKLVVSGNTIINDETGSPSIRAVLDASGLTPQIIGNHFYGLTSTQIIKSASVQSGNDTLASHPVLDASHPWASSTWNALVSGGAGNDALGGSAGNDLFVGGAGGDTFKAGAGTDTIADFSMAQGDKIDLSGIGGYSDFAHVLPHLTQSLLDTVIDLGSGNSLTLKNVASSSLAASSFLFSAPADSPDAAPVDINLSSTSIMENNKAGAIVASLSAVDTDPNDSFTFSLLDDAGGHFAINGANLVATTSFDYETNNTYAIAIRVTDAAGETYDKAVTIAVGNVPGQTITGTVGNDTIGAAATSEDDSINGGAGQDSINALGGDDTLDGGTGSDTLVGGPGNDHYVVDAAGDVLIENPGEGTDLVQSSVAYTLSANVENLTLTGTAANSATGNGGDNLIVGNSAANVLAGLGGADTLDGGNGYDTASYGASPSGVNVNLLGTPGTGGDGNGDVLKNIEMVIGSSFADTIQGSSGFNSLLGGDGDDSIGAASGNDTVDGGLGADTIAGAVGSDSLIGGIGNDLLSGGAGADTLSGGTGIDRFTFSALSESSAASPHDVITDFNHTEGDKVDVAAIDANTVSSGNQAFTFIGSQSFHHIAGELHYAAGTGGVIVSGDVNGDGVADFSIDVAAVSSMVSGDFIL